jgi:imidazoleglycerol-phosphate dehydratase
VRCRLTIEGRGRYHVRTGIRFLDHMLELVARHGGFDLDVDAKGDLDVDAHHTVEDVGIALGEAVARALGSKRGINRAGYFVMPMDETLAVAAIDLSGRPFAVVDLRLNVKRVGDLPRNSCRTSSRDLPRRARANVHLKVLYGRSSHHQIEAIFKAFARALRGGLRARCATAPHAAVRRRPAVRIALVDYGAGNPTSVIKAFSRSAPTSVVARGRRRSGRRSAIVVPGVGALRRHAVARRRRGGGTIASRFTVGARSSASASACSGCSTGARRRRMSPALACCRASRRGSPATSKCHTSGGTHSTYGARTRGSSPALPTRIALLLHAFLCGASERRHDRGDAARRRLCRPPSNAARCSACNSIPRSRAAPACAS